MDRRQEFLVYLQQPELCELFYEFMKNEKLELILEFYLACDELKKFNNQRKKPDRLVQLIYKHYLSSNNGFLPPDLMNSIEERLKSRIFTWTFYEHAQEYTLKYMLQMCFPKFLIEQKNQRQEKRSEQEMATVYYPMHRRPIVSKKLLINCCNNNLKLSFDNLKQYAIALTSGDDEDSSTVLDQQIAKTIDDADQCLIDLPLSKSTVRTNSAAAHRRNKETRSSSYRLIDVVWSPSLDSSVTLLSSIRYQNNSRLTFGLFRKLFRKSRSYRYFFKSTCTSEINSDQYVFRELSSDNELVPTFNGKIFLQLDRTD